MQNITNGKAFSIPWIIHEYTKQGTNGDFLLVSKLRLKTTPTFALEKQTRLMRKQTRFILTLPVAGAVNVAEKAILDALTELPCSKLVCVLLYLFSLSVLCIYL